MRIVAAPIAPAVLVACFTAAVGQQVPPPASKKAPDPPPPFPGTLKLKTDDEYAVAFDFTPDSRMLAIGDGQRIRFWNPQTGKEQPRDGWKMDEPASALAFVDPHMVATLEVGFRVVRVRAYPSGKEVARLDLGGNAHWAVADGLIATANDRMIRVWVGPEWKEQCRGEFPSRGRLEDDSPFSLTFSPDRKILAVGGRRASVYLYRVADGKLLASARPDQLGPPEVAELGLTPGGPPIGRVAFSPDGRSLAIAPVPTNPPPGRKDVGHAIGIWDAALTTPRTFIRWGEWSVRENPSGCMFTPDGKTLLVPCWNDTVRVYETRNWGLRHVSRVQSDPRWFALSPDGRFLALRPREGGGVFVFDWRAAGPEVPRNLNADARDAAWSDLASPDSATGYRVVVKLGANPAEAAKLIGGRLKPIAAPPEGVVKALVADLGAEDFAKREAASKELAKLGDVAEPELRVLAKEGVPEAQRRANLLLARLDRPDDVEQLRMLRAVEVLEYIDTPEARTVLRTLSDGAPSARLTIDAKAALGRLEARDPKP